MDEEPTPPISTEVPETVATDLRVDKATADSLNKDFADFWAEEDKEEKAPAPEAPTEGAAQQTKESKQTAHEKEPEPEPSKKDEDSDEDIDRFQMTDDHPRPQAIEDFKQIKKLWHADRDKARALRKEVDALNAQLTEAKNNAWTPEQKADYENAAAVRRRYDFASDPEFIQQYHAPIHGRFESILNMAVSVLPDRAAAQEWADHIKQNYKPDQLTREWWYHSVIDKVPDDVQRDQLRDEVKELLKLQRTRDGEIQRRTGDRSSYDNWMQEKTSAMHKKIQEDIMAEIGIQEKRIAEVLPRDPDSAKTKDERKAIEEHNERFKELNKYFTSTMEDLSKNGPKAWVRASVEATRSMLLETANKELESELKGLKKENEQYKQELERIQGARRRISHTSGTPPAPAGKKVDGTSLSIKDLDIRKSFDNYDWGDR